MRTYVAKTAHKRECDLCGYPILVGDRVSTWAWVDPDEPGGNIMRVHWTCQVVENISPRESFLPGCWSKDKATTAAEQLAVARAANPTPEALLETAVQLLRAALPILQPDAPLRWYKNDKVRDDVAKFLGRFK